MKEEFLWNIIFSQSNLQLFKNFSAKIPLQDEQQQRATYMQWNFLLLQ